MVPKNNDLNVQCNKFIIKIETILPLKLCEYDGFFNCHNANFSAKIMLSLNKGKEIKNISLNTGKQYQTHNGGIVPAKIKRITLDRPDVSQVYNKNVVNLHPCLVPPNWYINTMHYQVN